MMRRLFLVVVGGALGCHHGEAVSIGGYKPGELCRTVEYRMVVTVSRTPSSVSSEAPEPMDVVRSIEESGGRLATCNPRYSCDDDTSFLVQLAPKRTACREFVGRMSAFYPDDASGGTRIYSPVGYHWPPPPAPCTCDPCWWETGELCDTAERGQ